jgi:Ca-activated chloride channel family protein
MRGPVVRLAFVGALVSSAVSLVVLGAASAPLTQEPRPVSQQQRPRKVASPQNNNSTPAKPKENATPQPKEKAAPEEVAEGDVVRVDTELVAVPTVVSDRNGLPVKGLAAENFALFEDGEAQRITNFASTEAPFEIALLLDTSGSTRAELQLIRDAATEFVKMLRPGDRLAIVAFKNVQRGSSLEPEIQIQSPLTSDRRLIQEAINNIGTSSGTPFYDSLNRIADQVFQNSPRPEVIGRRAVVALTDGVDSSSESDFAQAQAKLLRAGLASYLIEVETEGYVEARLIKDCDDDDRLGLSEKQLERYRRLFDPDARPELYQDFCRLGQNRRLDISRKLYELARREMNEMARYSGGHNFVVADLSGARTAFAQVANALGTQYSLAYYPSNKAHDGRFRQIRVELRNVNYASVRAREGYFSRNDNSASIK